MKKKFLLFVFIVSSAFSMLNAQNLVPNPGFEVQDTCPAVSEIELAQPWVSASLGSPDLFNSTCSTQNLLANTGIGSSGVYLFNLAPNNREYLEAPLTSALTASQEYCVSFFVKRSNYRYGCNRIGAYFSTSLVDQMTTSALAFTPQVDNDPANMLSATGWIEVEGYFTAAGGESYIIIGSFSNDLNTDTVVVNAASGSKVCFYQIDNVSVTACNVGVGIEDNLLNEAVTVFPNPASDRFTINLPAETMVKSVSVYNHLGQQVQYNENPYNNNGTIIFDELNMAPGIYQVTILTDQGAVNRKLILQ